MKKKIISCILACTMGLGLLAGCGSSDNGGTTAEDTATQDSSAAETDTVAETAEADTAGGQDKVEIHYYSWSEGDYLQQMVDAFNASSENVTVKMTQVSSDEYDDKLMTMLAGDNDIDVFNMRSTSLLSNLAKSGNLTDISQMINDSGMDISIYGTGFADTKVDDKFYGLPYRASAYGLFYNKKMFDAKGVAYPDNLTWDEYADLAAELSEGTGADRILSLIHI